MSAVPASGQGNEILSIRRRKKKKGEPEGK